MVVKIFISDDCPNCPASKELGEKLIKKGIPVEFHDAKTSDGLAESLMHNVLSTPSTLIIKENKVVKAFLGETPAIEEVNSWL